MVQKAFFGHMVPGYIVNRDGSTTVPVTIPIGTIRMWDTGAVWFYVGDREPHNWDGFEGFIALGKRLGAELLYTFGRAPESQRIRGTMVPTMAAWNAFVLLVAERASGRINFWEMWNEPAVASLYWAGGTIQDLVTRARSGYKIIKALDPDAVVLTPSFNEVLAYGGAFADQYFRAMNAGARSADAISFHSYAGTPERVVAELNSLRAIMRRNRISLPIWCTEVALVGKTSQETATNLTRLHQIMASQVECLVWNAQIAGAEDYDASTMLGRAYKSVHDRLLSAP
jgi:polysaccharide biosynthesis protein PslG